MTLSASSTAEYRSGYEWPKGNSRSVPGQSRPSAFQYEG